MRRHYTVLLYYIVLVSLATVLTSTNALPAVSSDRNLRATATPPAPIHRRTQTHGKHAAAHRNLLAEKGTTDTETDEEERFFGLEKVTPTLGKLKDGVMAKLSPAVEKASMLTKLDEQKAAAPTILESLQKGYADKMNPMVQNIKKQADNVMKSVKGSPLFKKAKNQIEETLVNLAPEMVDWKVRYRVRFKQTVESVTAKLRGGASNVKAGTKEYYAMWMTKQEAILKQLSAAKIKDAKWVQKVQAFANSFSKAKVV
ncbi:uncharacterized protein IUM83_18774 [Phytophthora cinnamomi]|uniref:uncharacterized protein n=1 Tax=Phytophthora cinnamomi TaxID=4785 RepID=UPI00355A67D5|nr:hypothetical protein IUM83_18774 [Phytophthora cinnamomi]